MRSTLRKLKYGTLKSITRQLSHDRERLIDAVTDYMGAVFGEERMRVLTRTLQLGSDAERESARNTKELATPKSRR